MSAEYVNEERSSQGGCHDPYGNLSRRNYGPRDSVSEEQCYPSGQGRSRHQPPVVWTRDQSYKMRHDKTNETDQPTHRHGRCRHQRTSCDEPAP